MVQCVCVLAVDSEHRLHRCAALRAELHAAALRASSIGTVSAHLVVVAGHQHHLWLLNLHSHTCQQQKGKSVHADDQSAHVPDATR